MTCPWPDEPSQGSGGSPPEPAARACLRAYRSRRRLQVAVDPGVAQHHGGHARRRPRAADHPPIGHDVHVALDPRRRRGVAHLAHRVPRDKEEGVPTGLVMWAQSRPSYVIVLSSSRLPRPRTDRPIPTLGDPHLPGGSRARAGPSGPSAATKGVVADQPQPYPTSSESSHHDTRRPTFARRLHARLFRNGGRARPSSSRRPRTIPRPGQRWRACAAKSMTSSGRPPSPCVSSSAIVSIRSLSFAPTI